LKLAAQLRVFSDTFTVFLLNPSRKTLAILPMRARACMHTHTGACVALAFSRFPGRLGRFEDKSLKSLKKEASQPKETSGTCRDASGTDDQRRVLMIRFLACVCLVLALAVGVLVAENMRLRCLVGEVAGSLAVSRMELTRANIKIEQMQRTVRALRNGEID
jgi:hypothetical protein